MIGYTNRSELTFCFQESEITLQIAKESSVDGWDILLYQYPCEVKLLTVYIYIYIYIYLLLFLFSREFAKSFFTSFFFHR